MRKTLAAATMAASLTVGGAAGAALFTPTLSGAQTDPTAETETEAGRPGVAERIRESLEPLVADEVIDGAQADAVAEHLAEQVPLHHGHGGFGPGFGDAVLDALGLDAAELRERLAAGQSLADIAEANGIDVRDVVDAVVAVHQERLAAAVEAGRITQAEADERSATLREHAEDLVERTFEPGRHRHGRMGGHGPLGGLDDTTDETTDS